jgi:hypothetical protein
MFFIPPKTFDFMEHNREKLIDYYMQRLSTDEEGKENLRCYEYIRVNTN